MEPGYLDLTTATVTESSVSRVAIVDDNLAVLRSLQTLVACLGYDVVCSQHATEICRLVEAEPAGLDMLITDLEMPGMNGHELVDRVRVVRPDMPVLIVTGSVSYQRISGVSYLSKPCSSLVLATAIDGLARPS